MLSKRGVFRFASFVFVMVFLSFGVFAVTLDVWSYVEEGGVLNEEGNVTEYADNWTQTTHFSECNPAQGEYATGLRLDRAAGAGSVYTQVTCEKKGTGNNFNVNPIWDAKSPDCAVGPGIYTNIAVASSGANATFGCTGVTGCSGEIPNCVRLFNDRNCDELSQAECGMTGGDCTWDSDNSECAGWEYRPTCDGDTVAECSGTEFGCQLNLQQCSDYSNNKWDCRSHDECTWGTTSCTGFDKPTCKSHENSHDDCEWNLLSINMAGALNGSYECPSSSPIISGFAGFNGTGTSYCINDVFQDTSAFKATTLDTTIAGILPKCTSITNPACAYKFTPTEASCFWWFGGTDEEFRCPNNHYINGVRGFIGNCGSTGADVCAQVKCCSIVPTDNSREVAGNGLDDDCDGRVDEGYIAPGTPRQVARKRCTGVSDGVTNLACELMGVARSNATFCQYEGAYFMDAISSGGTTAVDVRADEPQYLFTVNYDLHEASCKCKYGNNAWNNSVSGWAPETFKNCCENGEGTNASEQEFLIQGKLDSLYSCCAALDNGNADAAKRLKWVSINGDCLLTDLYWANRAKHEISNSEVQDSVLLVVDHVELAPGTEVKLEVYDEDVGADTLIRGGAGALIGRVNDDHNLVANWTINGSDMIAAGNAVFGEGNAEFYFKVVGCVVDNQPGCADIVGKTSDVLDTSNDPHDDPFDLRIISPECGNDYNRSAVVQIIINASDEDDVIFGNLTIGSTVQPFTNGILAYNYTFADAGNIQISAFGVNTRGYMRRTISNVMIVNTAATTEQRYVAACINKPEDFSDIASGTVNFKADRSRGLRYVPGTGRVEVPKSSLRFYWGFSDGRTNPNVEGANPLSYDFWKTFQSAGHNWATLEVEYS